jgi:hypothetical protein
MVRKVRKVRKVEKEFERKNHCPLFARTPENKYDPHTPSHDRK